MIISIGIIFCILICSIHIYVKRNNNYNLHLHSCNELDFGHYSSIDSPNYIIYPELLFTSPMYISLKAGESLWIPKHWWHWISSDDITIAVNFWSDVDYMTTPKLFNTSFQDDKMLNSKIYKYDKNIQSFDKQSKTYKSLRIEELNNKTNSYIYTVKNTNSEFHSYVSSYIKKPTFFHNKDSLQLNTWIASGKHETGLHYDDNNNLLCMIKGIKNIILYPPSDSIYLRPYSVISRWAIGEPIQFSYNTYNYIMDLNQDISYPSSRLLYEMIMCYNNKKMLQIINDVIDKNGRNKVIYGCKIDNKGVFRCELYAYHIEKSLKKMYIDKGNQLRKIRFKNIINNDNTISVHSFDLFNTKECLGDEIHFYHVISNPYSYPFFGSGSTLIENGKIQKESLYFLNDTNGTINNFEVLMNRIKMKDFLHLKYLLYKYNCKSISIHNKFNKQFYIQFFDILLDSFIEFIKEFNYPINFIEHVTTNYTYYKDIKHEITIVFDIDGKPLRSSFYGIV